MPRRPTTTEIEERIELCRTLLLRRIPKSTIKRLFRAKFGAEIHAETIETYLRRARDAILADIGRGEDVHRATALGFYEMMLADPAMPGRDKIKAQERIDKLLGLEAARRVDVTSKGQPLTFIAMPGVEVEDGDNPGSTAAADRGGDDGDDAGIEIQLP